MMTAIKNMHSMFLVDDDSVFLSALKKSLVSNDPMAKIKTFSSGEECLKNIDEHPNIVVLDFYMNNTPSSMNGLEVLKKIKTKSPETEVIMLSCQDSIEVALDTINHGAYDYVVKSRSALIRIKHLISKVNNKFQLMEENEKYDEKYKKINLIVIIIFLLILLLKWIL